MIPKTVHYCWFGSKPKTELAKKCIASWKKYLPDYEFIEWNESNFDINQHPFTRESYQAKKYAFVTDYVRLFVLKKYGGIYMDTDVEVVRNLDCFLHLPAFSGFEDSKHIPTGIMASKKNGEWVSEMLEYYTDRHFINPDESLNITTNTHIITSLMAEKGILMNDTKQTIPEIVTFYPHDFFCPKDFRTEKIRITENTYTIHHFAKSWKEPESFSEAFLRKHPFIDRCIVNISNFMKKILGNKWSSITSKIRKVLGLPPV